MKKALSLLLALVMCLSLFACGEQKPTGSQPGGNNQTCNHQYNETARVDATKSEDGSVSYTCALCGNCYEEVLYATGSAGLRYESNDDGSCTVVGLGTCTDNHVVIPAFVNGVSVTSIGNSAFYDCSSLTSITIPDSVTSIGHQAFKLCSNLTSITIPDSITSIGGTAFKYCDSLTEVHISDIASWCGISFSDYISNPLCNGGGLYLDGTLVENLVIPDSVTSIGASAFWGCSSLTSITISSSVTSIGDSAFEYCSNLTSVIIHGSVTSIGARAFEYCSNLTSVIIHGSVTSIGARAFSDCSSLTSITIPDSVTSIGGYAFDDCSRLQEIHFTGTMEQWNAISKDFDWNCFTGKYTIFCTDGEIQK